MLGEPSLIPGNDTGNSQSKALLPQQWVTSVTTTKGHNLTAGRKMTDHDLVWVTWPVVDDLSWNQWNQQSINSCFRDHIMNPTHLTTNSFVNLKKVVEWTLKFVKILENSLKMKPCTDLGITYSALVWDSPWNAHISQSHCLPEPPRYPLTLWS